ncbi:hypothetical protein LY78DRAFT_222228 [Colletotrichum sublineola]|nr:hypothetical protein LY78DRAFT_222228 [Colletotrichum sublineola]
MRHSRWVCGHLPNRSQPFDNVRPLPWLGAIPRSRFTNPSTYIPQVFGEPSRHHLELDHSPTVDDTPRPQSHSTYLDYGALRAKSQSFCLCLDVRKVLSTPLPPAWDPYSAAHLIGRQALRQRWARHLINSPQKPPSLEPVFLYKQLSKFAV